MLLTLNKESSMIKLGYEVDIKNDIIENSRHGNTKTFDDLDSAISKFNFDPTINSQNKSHSLKHDLGRGALKGAAAGALVGGAMLLANKRKAKESESNKEK